MNLQASSIVTLIERFAYSAKGNACDEDSRRQVPIVCSISMLTLLLSSSFVGPSDHAPHAYLAPLAHR